MNDLADVLALGPVERELVRLQRRVAELSGDLGRALDRISIAETELKIYKRRCYPTPSDVLRAGIAREQCEAWLVKVGATPVKSTCVSAYQLWTLDDVEYAWRFDAPPGRAIAEAIEWACDYLGLDQWVVLGELSAVSKGTDAC